jgi:hypothetical protein
VSRWSNVDPHRRLDFSNVLDTYQSCPYVLEKEEEGKTSREKKRNPTIAAAAGAAEKNGIGPKRRRRVAQP